MRKKALLFVLSLSTLLLSGCFQVSEPVAELRATFGGDRNTVVFEVVGARAARYEWDFGDGQTMETTLPKAVHRYAVPGQYLVSVKGYGKMNTGSGGPGPGTMDPNVLAFHLTMVVDTRPAIEIVGMRVTPIDPPPWYAPGTPAWPNWHYPAATHLRFELLYVVNRQGEIGIQNVQWIITDSYGRFKKAANAFEWIWYEAMFEFIAYGCPARPTEYRVYLTVIFTDRSEWKVSQSIWACPSGGCL
jgi:hypothetical protein